MFGSATNAVGECGATSGPKSAIRTRTATIPSPIRVRVSRDATRRTWTHWRWRSDGGASGSAVRSSAIAVGGHRADVRSRGVSMIVARSAAKLTTT